MSSLGMFGKVAAGYLKAAEATRDKQSAAEKEQRETATSILMKMIDDPSTRPETIKWALGNLTEIASGKWKGKLDISKIPTGQADPGQPPELGQMAGAPARPPTTLPMPPETSGGAPALPFELPGQAGAAGPPAFQAGAMPTPPPPTGAQYLTPMSQGEQLRQGAGSIEDILLEAGVAPEIVKQALTQKLTGLRPPTPVKPTKPTAIGYKVIKGPGDIATGVESLGPTKEQFLPDDPNMPEEARGLLDKYQAARLDAAATKVEADAKRDARTLARAVELIEKRADVAKEKVGHKLADTARTSDKLVEKMDAMLQEIEQTGVVTGPQAMALLSWHMSMTVGGIKGARVGRDIIEKHLAARSWPQSLDALARKIMAKGGEAGIIPPSQATEWVHLARVRRTADWNEALGGIRSRGLDVTQFGVPADILGGGGIPSPPNTLTDAEALAYLEQAGGDKDKARVLARADGKRF